jgi:hypothetical protein
MSFQIQFHFLNGEFWSKIEENVPVGEDDVKGRNGIYKWRENSNGLMTQPRV